MPEDIVFRIATPQDADDITHLVNTTYHGPESIRGWTPEAHLHAGPRTHLNSVMRDIENPNARIVLAYSRGSLVGCATIEHHGDDAHFGMFAVRPSLQGGGIGRAILAETERLAADLWQCKTMTMSSINLQENLIAYYERRGFVPTGERQPFPFAENAGALRTDYDLIILRKDLKPSRP